MKKNWKRILAAMLAASMIFGNAVPAYATESQPVVEVVEAETEVVEDTVLEDAVVVEDTNVAEETVEERNNEEGEEILVEEVVETDTVLEYQASEYLKELSGEGWAMYCYSYDSEDHYLIVELQNPEQISMDEVISAIKECKTAMASDVEARGNGYNYCRIEIQYNNLTDGNFVPATLWNALVEYSETASAEETDTWFFFFDRYGIQYKYVFENTQKISDNTSSIDMNMSANVTGDSAAVTFTNTTFAAEDERIFFEINTLRNTEEVTNFTDYFGEENVELELLEKSSSEKKDNLSRYFYNFEGYTSDDELMITCEIRIDSIHTLSIGTYELRKAGEGDGEDNENSFNITETVRDGKNILVIDGASHSDYDVFEADVVTALESQTKKYDGVEISYLNPYVDNYSEYVAKEVWNAAVGILNAPEEDEEVSLWFNRVFENTDITDEEGTYAANSNWHIPNPVTVEDDIYLEIAYDSNTHTLTTGNNNFPANTSAYWNLWTPVNCDDYIVEFGDSEEEITLELCKNGESVGVDAFYCVNYEESDAFTESVNLYAIDVAALEANTSYTLQRKVYFGKVEELGNGRRKITLSPFDAGKDEAFTLDELKEITTVLKEKEEAYEFVEYIIPISDNNVIKADLAEELRTILLDYEDSMEFLCFTFADEEHSYVIGLLDPSMEPTYGEDVAIDLNIAFDADNKQVSYTQNGIKLDAESGVFGYNHVPDSGFGKQLYECFGGTFEFWHPFTEANDSEIEAFYVPQKHNIYFEIDADDLFDGTEKAYKFTQSPYRGVEEEWDNGVRAIAFYPSDLESYGIEFSEETIADMLEDFTSAGESYDAVVIQYPEIPDSVSADLWNKAVNALSNHEEKCIQLRFSGGDTYDINWHFSNPETTESLDLDVEFVIGEEGEYGTVKFAETELPVDYAEVNFVSEENNGESKADFDKFRDAFGYESMIGLDILDSEGKHNLAAEAIYSADEDKYEEGRNTAELCVRNITALESDEIYTFEMSAYRGYVEGDEEWRSIFLTSYAFGKEKLDPADFEEIIEFYVNNNIKFDVVEFEQSNVTSNVIDKDMINLARAIMKDPDESERRLTFIFCDCDMDEEGNWVQKDLRWNLMNPGIASKDINASVTMSVLENYGVKFNINANTYNADDVHINYMTSEGSDQAERLHAALDVNSEQMLLKKSTDIVFDRNVGLWQTGDEGELVELFIGNVLNLEGKTEYLICDLQFLNDPEDENDHYKVGDTTTIELKHDVDPKTVTWKSHSPEKTEVSSDGTIKFLSNGGEHFISAKYKFEGKDVFELFWARAELHLDKIAFQESEVTLEFWPNDVDKDWANRGWLAVRYYPSNAGMDSADLRWDIVDEDGNSVETDVIEFIGSEEDGRMRGEIRGLKEGTAIVKVTHPDDENIYATCTVTVEEAADYIPEEKWEETWGLHAFAYADKILDDIELPENWDWVNPKQSLKNYYDTYGHQFEATYNKNGHEIRTSIWLNMITIKNLNVIPVGLDGEGNVTQVEEPKSLKVGDKFVWGFDVETKGDPSTKFIEAVESGRFLFVASDNLTYTDEDSIVGANAEDCRMFTAVKKGTQKFNVAIRDTYTGKDIVKASWSLKVYEKLVDFDQLIVDVEGSNESFTEGKLHMYLPVDEYIKISSVKVSDKKVLSIGKPVVEAETVSFEEGQHEGVDPDTEYVDTWVTFKDGTPGMTQLIITVADDAKSTHTRIFRTREKEPKLLQPSFQINKAYDHDITMCNIQFADYYPYAKDENHAIEVVGTYSNLFEYIEDTEASNYENGKIIGFLKLKNDSVKNGTYDVQLKIPVDRSEDGGTVDNYTTTVKVKVISKEPAIKIKQTTKVNTFYIQSEESTEGCGTLTFDIGNLGWVDENSISLLEGDDFTIVPEGNGIVKVIYTPDNDGVIEKTLKFELKLVEDVNGYITLEKTVKIQTEDKAPTIVPSAKTDTVYPKQGAVFVPVRLTDKATGEEIKTWETSVLINKKTGEILPFTENEEEYATVTMSKNEIAVGRETADYNIIYFVVANANAVDSTEKFTINVREENWSRPVTFNYTLKVATKAPKLQLGASTLSLNVNEGVRDNQVARTSLTLAKCSISFWDEVNFTGMDAKSKAILNKGLSLNYDYERRQIVARFNISETDTSYQVEKGTYSFNVWAKNWNYNGSITLKIKVTDVAPEKCIKLTKKGAIDVLLHESSSITYTPKLNGISGEVIDAWLEGQDAYMFDYYYEEGKLVIKANAETARNEGFNTKHSYKVTPVFEIENPDDDERYSVYAAEQSIKVSQGKPKVSVTAYNGNTIYSLAGNELKIYMNATLKNEDVAIENVELLNYTEDVHFEYNPESQQIILSRQQPKQITTNGKSWALKFAVTFVDSAGNEKPVQVTYKVTIK